MREMVLNKPDFYRRWLAGEFGNRPRAWNCLADMLKDDYSGLCSVRCKDPDFGKYSRTHLTVESAIQHIQHCSQLLQLDESCFALNESMPDDSLVIQGYFTRSWLGWELHYSHERTGMVNALKQSGKIVSGLRALATLRYYLHEDAEDILQLIDDYPGDHQQDATIEFSTYSMPVGVLQRHTIIFEVRHY